MIVATVIIVLRSASCSMSQESFLRTAAAATAPNTPTAAASVTVAIPP